MNNNGITPPIRTAPLYGSPQLAAYHSGQMNNEKLSQLNNVVGGKKRNKIGGASTIQVSTINPIYSNTFGGNQNPITQQVNSSSIQNQLSVQASGDQVQLVTRPTSGGKRKSKKTKILKKKQKSKKYKKIKTRKTRK
jgi:hypothetical protein